jgi:hypothetical protein
MLKGRAKIIGHAFESSYDVAYRLFETCWIGRQCAIRDRPEAAGDRPKRKEKTRRGASVQVPRRQGLLLD